MQKDADCPVCLEPIQEAVLCPYCDYKCCMTCVKSYVLSQTALPHCMSCKTGWTAVDRNGLFPSSWLNGTKKGDYRTKRKEVLFAAQKARLPEFASHIDRVIMPNKRYFALDYEWKARKKKIEVLQARKAEIMNELLARIELSLKKEEIERLKKEKKRIMNEMDLKINNMRRDLERWVASDPLSDNEVTKKGQERPKILSGCPKEGCNGMVKFPGVCVVCETKACMKCAEEKKEGHECDKNAVESLKLIRKSTKLCPNPSCNERIEKIDGCDQMWCTSCGTAFSWKTGELVVDPRSIHNPHYFHWLRESGRDTRNVNNVPCGGFIHQGESLLPAITLRWVAKELEERRFISTRAMDEHDKNELFWSFMRIFRFTDIVIEKTAYSKDQKLMDAGCEYLMGNLTEKAWRNKIFRIEREDERRGTIREIVAGMRHASIEHYNGVLDAFSNGTFHTINKESRPFLEQLLGILEIFSDTLEKELAPYKMKNPTRISSKDGLLIWEGAFCPANEQVRQMIRERVLF